VHHDPAQAAPNPPYAFVDRGEDLAALTARLTNDAEVALDTEFMRERTYFPLLCLVQVATDHEIACIDPLAIGDLAPLATLLTRPSVRVVLHAARQDIEVLLTRCGGFAARVFDTQVAAALLGMPPQVGYGDLVQRILGVELEKAHARTDWAARPLREEQLDYAAEDVRHLLPLRGKLELELLRMGRFAWFEYEMSRLADLTLYRTDPAEAWQRLKGLDTLDPRRAHVARALAEWRERRAMQRDRPRAWILSDETLFELVRALPGDVPALARLPTLPRAVLEKCGTELVELIAESSHLGEQPFAGRRRTRPDPQQEARLKSLAAIVRRVGGELGLSPEILATRRDLMQILAGRRDVEPLRAWRREVIGEQLLAAL
jgi:ribonuclease D